LQWQVTTSKNPRTAAISAGQNYLKVIVEWFRRIEAERTGPLRKR
jgi:hypothetical protein